MLQRRFGRWVVLVALLAGGRLDAPAHAASWTRAYVAALPDSAFAAVATGPSGEKLRHLPHHDRHGRVDLPHLRSALSRLRQVHWQDPRQEAAARAHLLQHLHDGRRPAD